MLRARTARIMSLQPAPTIHTLDTTVAAAPEHARSSVRIPQRKLNQPRRADGVGNSSQVLRILHIHEERIAGLQRQYDHFRENWMNRGLPTVELIFASELGFRMSAADGL